MKLTNLHIVLLSGISVLAIVLVVYYQYRILTEQQQVTEQQRLNNTTAFNLSVMELAQPVRKVTAGLKQIDTLRWQLDKGLNEHEYPTKEFDYHFDSLFKLHNLRDSYQLKGLITNSGYCQIEGMDMGRKKPEGKAGLLSGQQHNICLCHYSGPYSFDVSYNLMNQMEPMFSYQEPTIISIGLILIVFLTFLVTLNALRKQKKISDLRESFVNTLSHNFETPIFSINLAVKSLRKVIPHGDQEKTDRFLALIASENQRLKNYSEKILHEALISTENLELDLESVDVLEVVQRVVESLSILVEQKQMNLKTLFKASDALIIADKTHFFNTIYNLIDNAIKYSQTGQEVVITVTENDNEVLVEIKDKGIGMDSTTLKNIFKKYYRGQEARNSKGFGLGLSYVKRIIDLHGYNIRIESQKDYGTQVRLELSK